MLETIQGEKIDLDKISNLIKLTIALLSTLTVQTYLSPPYYSSQIVVLFLLCVGFSSNITGPCRDLMKQPRFKTLLFAGFYSQFLCRGSLYVHVHGYIFTLCMCMCWYTVYLIGCAYTPTHHRNSPLSSE